MKGRLGGSRVEARIARRISPLANGRILRIPSYRTTPRQIQTQFRVRRARERELRNSDIPLYLLNIASLCGLRLRSTFLDNGRSNER